MKYSIYNNYIEYDNKFIAFNAMAMTFLHIDPLLMELINNQTPEQIKTIHPDFYFALKGNGFICNDDSNEYLNAVKLMQEINNDPKSYRLIINPTTSCNFSCWYCYESHSKTSKMSEETIRNVCRYIEKIVSRPELKHFQLSFFGGEPLMYYSDVMLPIADFAHKSAIQHDKDFAIDITSNGYLFNTDRFKKLLKLGLKSCQITLDGSKELHDKTRFPFNNTGSYSNIINNIHIAVRLGINIVLRINYTKKNLTDLELILKDFEDLSIKERDMITLSMNKVWQETANDLKYDVNKFTEAANEFGFQMPDALLADRVRNPCYADKINEAVINYDGKVYKCNARDFTDDRHEGILNCEGNIIWNKLYHKRNKTRNINQICKTCSIFPICGGGCSQFALENSGKDYCIGKDESNEIITQMFLSKYCTPKS